MADIATAYIQIKPTLKGVKNEITSELGGNVGSSSGSMFGGAFVSTLKTCSKNYHIIIINIHPVVNIAQAFIKC